MRNACRSVASQIFVSVCACMCVRGSGSVCVCNRNQSPSDWHSTATLVACLLPTPPALCRAQQAKCLSEIVIEFPNSSHQHNDNAHYQQLRALACILHLHSHLHWRAFGNTVLHGAIYVLIEKYGSILFGSSLLVKRKFLIGGISHLC